ncbi:MAG: hypothetical protein DRN30_03665 [Thermoplasmata archaeon]|nr:MAG: hypothetical protein DRN30_03665 [Thermoplasmata archaeon]
MNKAYIGFTILAFMAGCASPSYRNMHKLEDPAQVDTLMGIRMDWIEASEEISYRMRKLENEVDALRGYTNEKTDEFDEIRNRFNIIIKKRQELIQIEENLLHELERLQQLDKAQRKALIKKVNRFMGDLRKPCIQQNKSL